VARRSDTDPVLDKSGRYRAVAETKDPVSILRSRSKTFFPLAFPRFPGLESSLKSPSFDGELMASSLTSASPSTVPGSQP
jgi:hypothetical protein